MIREVYIPVRVTLDDNDNIVEAGADFEGAPWMYVDSEENVWGPGEDGEYEWSRDSDLEETAIALLAERLRPVETVTVFVALMGGAFPGAIEGDVRVYRGYEEARLRATHPGWVKFSEVSIQDADGIVAAGDAGDTTP